MFALPKQKMFFQTLPKTVYKEHSFKWKLQSYLIHELRNAIENTLGANGELSKETNHPKQQNCPKDMENNSSW